MKNVVLEPMIADDSVIVQFTDNIIVDKHIAVKAPNGFVAVVLIDERVAFRINAGADRKLCDYGKDYIGAKCKVAFISTKLLPQMMWGFGNIPVNNERLKETYCIGANGKYSVEIVEAAKLIKAFGSESNITIESIRDKTIGILRNLGNAVMGRIFSESDISVFEVASQIERLRHELFDVLQAESSFSNIGIKLNDLIVEKIHVDEDDLDSIRSRMNESEQHTSQTVDRIGTELSHFKMEFSDIIAAELRRSEQKSIALLEAELGKYRSETAQAFCLQMQKQLSEFGESIYSEIDDMITERLPLREEVSTIKEPNTNISARTLLENADENDDMVVLASLIYSKVEENLIYKFKLPHRDEKFYMSYQDYIKAVDRAKVGERFFLMERDKNGILRPLTPRVLETSGDGTPLTVEMHPIIRFMKAGLDPQEAKRATEMWSVINKIRHKSAENQKRLNELFSKYKPRKEYMKEVLDFYQEKQLYTED